jgi:hypothetical protein
MPLRTKGSLAPIVSTPGARVALRSGTARFDGTALCMASFCLTPDSYGVGRRGSATPLDLERCTRRAALVTCHAPWDAISQHVIFRPAICRRLTVDAAQRTFSTAALPRATFATGGAPRNGRAKPSMFTFLLNALHPMKAELRSTETVRSNPSLHSQCFSGFRPLTHLGELKR